MIAELFGFSVNPDESMDNGLIFLYYALYFGILGQDVARICAPIMASHLGVSVISIVKTNKI